MNISYWAFAHLGIDLIFSCELLSLFVDVSETLKYCYKLKNCFGQNTENATGVVMTHDECCIRENGGSWGVPSPDEEACAVCSQSMCQLLYYFHIDIWDS